MKLSPRKELAARLIAAGHTQVDVYKDTRVNVTKQTMSAWCHESDFIERVDILKIDVVANVQKILIDSAPDAAEALVGLVTSNGSEKMSVDDIKIATLKLKGSLWILERVLGKEQIRAKPIIDGELVEEVEEDFAPDAEEIDSVINALN